MSRSLSKPKLTSDSGRDHDRKKACVSECEALYRVDTYAKTEVKTKTKCKDDARVKVNGKITLSDRCEIVPGCVERDECDPCVTRVSFDILLPISADFEAECKGLAGTSYVVADVKNYLYNKVTPIGLRNGRDKGHKGRPDPRLESKSVPKLESRSLPKSKSVPELKKDASRKPADPARV